jgi:hypothetical protein
VIQKPFAPQNPLPTGFTETHETQKSQSIFDTKYKFGNLKKENRAIFLIFGSIFNQFFIQNSNFE